MRKEYPSVSQRLQAGVQKWITPCNYCNGGLTRIIFSYPLGNKYDTIVILYHLHDLHSKNSKFNWMLFANWEYANPTCAKKEYKDAYESLQNQSFCGFNSDISFESMNSVKGVLDQWKEYNRTDTLATMSRFTKEFAKWMGILK